MTNTELEQYKRRVKERLEALTPIFANIAIGDFSEKPDMPESEDEFTELYAALHLMIDDLRLWHEQAIQGAKTAAADKARLETTEKDRMLLEEKAKKLEDSRSAMIYMMRDIKRTSTELEKTYETLKESEEHYKTLVETSPDSILVTDSEFNIITVNKQVVSLGGWESEKELIGKNIMELIAEDSMEAAIYDTSKLLETGVPGVVEYNFMKKNGTSFPGEASAAIIFDDKKKPQAVIIVVRDATERKKAEKSKELAAHVLTRLNVGNEKERIIGDIIQFVKEYMGVEAAAIRLKDGDDYPYYTTNGFPNAFVEAERHLCVRDEKGQAVCDSTGNPILECMCGNVIRGRTNPDKPFFTKGGSFWTNGMTKLLASTTETDRMARTRDRCNIEGYESVALIPLRAGKKSETIGLLQLNDKRENAFTLAQIEFLEGLGNSIGIAIARKQMEDVVKQSEEKYKTLVESATDLIFMVGKDHRVISLNTAAASALGEKPEGAVGKHIHELFPKNIADGYAASIDEVFKTGKKQLREFGMVASGKESIMNVTLSAVMDSMGNTIAVVGIARDMTGQKKAEMQIAQSKKDWEETFDTMTDMITVHDKDYNIIRANKAAEKMLGLPIFEKLHKTKCFRHYHGTEKPPEGCPSCGCLKSGKAAIFEIYEPHLKKDIEIRAIPRFDKDNNQVGIIHIVRDLTEQKKAEKERAELLKEHARGEIHGFLISSLPVFTANVPPEVRNSLIRTFADKFEQNFRPVLVRALTPVLPAPREGGIKEEPDWNKILGAYMAWSSELLSNLGIDAKTEVSGAKDEGVSGRIEFTNCPWIKDARDNPVFCMICKTMVLRSFAWLSDNGNASNTSTIANGADRCAFEMRIAENQ